MSDNILCCPAPCRATGAWPPVPPACRLHMPPAVGRGSLCRPAPSHPSESAVTGCQALSGPLNRGRPNAESHSRPSCDVAQTHALGDSEYAARDE